MQWNMNHSPNSPSPSCCSLHRCVDFTLTWFQRVALKNLMSSGEFLSMVLYIVHARARHPSRDRSARSDWPLASCARSRCAIAAWRASLVHVRSMDMDMAYLYCTMYTYVRYTIYMSMGYGLRVHTHWHTQSACNARACPDTSSML